MWQYSDSGSVSGINGKVDMNYLIGSPTDHGTAVTHHTYEAALTAPTCTGQGFSTHTCTICGNSYAANATASLGHSYENAELVFDEETKTHFAICSRCGAACGILRISGQNRYATSFAIADTMKQTLGTEKFDTIIVASGTGFADALSGSYLAAVKNAPILISDGKNSADLAVYIRENLSSGGRVYLLGGTGVLSENLENALKAECSDVKRLRGSTRYETNLAILQEAGIGAADVLICTGTGFADSLSASAAGKPILLVSGALTDAQKEFLNTNCQGSTFHIIGGTGAVSSGIEETLRSGGHTVKRIGGSSRYETSAMVARQFFDDPSSAILAYSMNFPDGLCGGALAHAMGAPMLLTAQNQESVPASYVSDHGITTGYILGGSAAVSDATAGVVFGMGSNTVIPKK